MKNIFIIKGGIGNQLYIYSESLKYNKSYIIFYPRQLHSNKKEDNINGLISFNNNIGWKPGEKNYFKMFLTDLLCRLLIWMKESIKISLFKNILKNEYFQNNLDIDTLNKTFKNIQLNKKIHNKFENRTKIAIHIRRGDYLSAKVNNLYYIPDVLWYISMLDNFLSFSSEPNVYIFSDDVTWVKNVFLNKLNENLKYKKSYNIDIVDIPAANSILLMSTCNYVIGSSSTLSYWSIMIGKKLGTIIDFVLPLKYYNHLEEQSSPNLIY